MATFEKFVKAVEAVKLYQSPTVLTSSTESQSMSKKEKIIHCSSLTDTLISIQSNRPATPGTPKIFPESPGTSNAPPGDLFHYLSLTMETFFTFCDDDEAEVRFCVEENLNKVIRSLTESNVSRLQVELYKEIKKNSSFRRLRVALTRFADTVHLIRTQKSRAYISNLLPCLVEISERTEESMHEVLAQTVPIIFNTLGIFATDDEIQTILDAFLKNLDNTSSSVRRSTALCLTSIASQAKNASHFVPWLLKDLIQRQDNDNIDISFLLGIFSAMRSLLPVVKEDDDIIIQDPILTIYELCLLKMDDSNVSIVSGTLELFLQLLKNAPSFVKIRLLSHQGLDKRFLSKNPSESDRVGTLLDKDVPLIHAARKIAANFLLTPRKAELRKEIRVSVQTLAISCITVIFSLSPKIFLLTLFIDQDEEDFDETPLIRDLTHYVHHEDPQLNGSAAIMLGTVLKGCLLESGGLSVDVWFNHRRPDHNDIVQIFRDLISQPGNSAITVKLALNGVKLFLSAMLSTSLARSCGRKLLLTVLESNLASNPYWLVRTELCEVLSTLKFDETFYLDGGGTEFVQTRVFEIFASLSSDEDSRVRTSVAKSVVQIVPNLYFRRDWPNEATASAYKLGNVNHYNLLRTIDYFHQLLLVSKDTSRVLGCIQVLSTLTKEYPVSRYPQGWRHVDRSVTDIVTHFLRMSTTLCVDVVNHTMMIDLLGRLSSTFEKSEVLKHCMRILNMINRLATDESVVLADTETSEIGHFALAPHYVKIFESVKNVYSAFKTTLEPDTKFIALLKSCLQTLKSALDQGPDCDKTLTEELLKYFKTTIILEPDRTLQCVQSLLSCIFKAASTSTSSSTSTAASTTSEDEETVGSSSISVEKRLHRRNFYDCGFRDPYQSLLSKYKLSTALDASSLSSSSSTISLSSSLFRRTPPLRSSDRAVLASYIRLFEPIVIKALKHYTLTSHVDEQSQVLRLLVQLVRLRVNYCLLDSDQIFVGYIVKQLEHIEDGQIANAHCLIPDIFHFLIMLSLEKYHSQFIIHIPKIIELINGLIATGKDELIVPAILPVAEDLFCHRHANGGESVDLETHRDVILGMLIQYMEHSEVLKLIIVILDSVKVEDRWRKLSRTLFDNILPLLTTQKLRLDDIESLDLLHSFFLSLAPGTLRPVDSLLSAVLTTAVDLSSLRDVQRWLSFVIASLCTISNQSPEEGILSRLEELSPIPDVLDTSMESSTSTINSEINGTKAEVTFSRFLFQVVGASLSKLHQLVYEDEQRPHILKEQVSVLLNFIIYVLKDGRFCRVTKAAQTIANEDHQGRNDMPYTLDFIDEIAIQLCHVAPFITLQWANLLILLNRVHQPLWAKLLSVNTPILPCLNAEILRKGSLLLLCDFLSGNSTNVELITWLVINFSADIIDNIREEPVASFVKNVHANAPLSGLFLQAVVTRCGHLTSVYFQKKMLKSLENLHEAHSAKLLTFLIEKFLTNSRLSLSTRVQYLCCKRAELILNGIAERPSADQLSNAMESLRRRKRFGRLIGMLNKLSESYMDLSPLETDEGRAFTPGSLSDITPNKDWFIAQLRNKCSSPDEDGQKCAEMLTFLDPVDAIAVMIHPDFNVSILEACLNEPCLVQVTKRVLFDYRLKDLMRELPDGYEVYSPTDWTLSPVEVRYKAAMNSKFQSPLFRSTMVKLFSAVSTLDLDNDHYEDNNDDDSLCSKKRFYLLRLSVLSLEYCKWLLYYCTEFFGGGGREDHRHSSLRMARSVFRNPHLMKGLDPLAAVNAVHCLYAVLRGLYGFNANGFRRGFTCQRYKELLSEDEASPAVLANLKINFLFTNVVKQKRSPSLPTFLSNLSRDIVIGLARLPQFVSYVRIPPDVWKSGWSEGVPFGPLESEFPLVSIDSIQDLDVLRDYVFRTNVLGWSTRQQFEETWVTLLGVFSASWSDDYGLDRCSALVIQTTTLLLIQTLDLPFPGHRNTSKPLQHPRDVPSQFFDTVKGQALTSVQNQIHSLLKRAPFRFLPIDSSLNLERVSENEDFKMSQVSLNYILTSIGSESAKKRIPLPYLLREEALSESGLDLVSCLHFLLFDLYDRWFTHPGEVSLVLLTEAVTSVVMLSDIFTDISHFKWMFKHFSEIQRVHSAEDEILTALLRIGLAKAIAVLGANVGAYGSDSHVLGGDIDDQHHHLHRIKKSLDSGFKSQYLPAKLSSLQGMLYLLQRRDWNDVGDQFLQALLKSCVDYLVANLPYQYGIRCHSHLALMWSLAFYILENFETTSMEGHWSSNVVIPLALSTVSKAETSRPLYLLLLAGIERLVVAGKHRRSLDRIMKLSTDLLSASNPVLALPSIQLFLACMYYKRSKDEDSDMESEGLMHAMEQMSILFDCIRRSGPDEAKLLCQVLPKILVDFFPPSDVINRVISEFISPGQPHQTLLAGVVFAVFRQASRDHYSMLQEWVLSTLPNFIKRSPISHSAWCLSCFFLSVPSLDAATDWLQALFPHLQLRLGSFTPEDKKLFCLAAKEFYRNLKDKVQKEKFVQTFRDVAQPKTPYYDLLQSL